MTLAVLDEDLELEVDRPRRANPGRLILHTNPATGLPYRHGTAFTFERGCRCSPCHAAREPEHRWLPIEPALAALAGRGWSLHEAEANTQVNLRKSEWLTTQQADTIACRIGEHPINIWGLEVWGAERVQPEELGQLVLPFAVCFDPPAPRLAKVHRLCARRRRKQAEAVGQIRFDLELVAA